MTATATRGPGAERAVRRAVVGEPPPPPPPSHASRLETVLVAAALGVVGAASGSLFAKDTAAIGFAIATALPVLLAGVARHLRWSLVRSVVASLVVGVVVVVLVALVDTLEGGLVPTADTARALLDGLTDGWAILLDTLLPIREAPEASVFLTALCWLTGMVTGELTARTRLVAHPMLPAAGLAGVLLLLHAPLGPPAPVTAAVVVGAVLLVPLVRATPERVLGERRPPGRLSSFDGDSGLARRLTTGVPVAVAAVAIGALVAQVLTLGADDDPFDPRDLRGDTVAEPDAVSPLIQLKSVLLSDPEIPALRIAFLDPDDALAVERLPLVRLDAFDGATWTSTSTYRPSNGAIGTSATSAEVVRTVRAAVVLEDPTGPWLPAPGTPTSIDVDAGELLADAATGNLLPFAEGTIPSYRTVSEVVLPTAAEREAATPSATAADAPYLLLPEGLPAALSAAVVEATDGVTGTWPQLAAIESWLETNVTYDVTAPSGHSYARLADLVAGDGRGFAEQFAAAYTVMARSIGVPARVVVGYRLVTVDEAGRTVPLGELSSAQLHAWAEVHLSGLGWVAVDPSPLTPGEAPVAPAPEQGPGTTIAEGQVVGEAGGGPEESGPTESEAPAESEGFGPAVRLVVAAVATAALVAALGLLAIVAVKARRRATRRQASEPADRLLGAWAEAQDRLAESGVEIRPSMTPGEIGQEASTSLSRAAVAPVIALIPDVRRTLFAAQPPNEAMADQAWQRLAELEQGLRIEQGRIRALRNRFDPRPLRRS